MYYRCQKGLRGVHADKSAANICKLRQWSSQQPSCLDYIVLDDRLPVMAATCERGVTATREGSPLVQLQQPATQILTALLLQKRRWDRPLGTVHFATVKCQLIQQFCDHPSHKICNSISEMNSAFQFALARSSGHSEGCHHVKLLQPRVNAVRQILHSGTPNEDKLGFTKFQFQLLLSSFAFGSHALHMANLFVLKRTQIPSFVMLWGKSECPQKFKSLVDSHSAKTDSFY